MYLFQVYYSLLVPAFELQYHHCYQPDPFIDIFYYFMSSSCEQYKKDSKSCSLRFLIWCSLLNVGTNIYYLCNLSRLRLSISNLSERNLFASAQIYIRLWRDQEMIQTVGNETHKNWSSECQSLLGQAGYTKASQTLVLFSTICPVDSLMCRTIESRF